MAFFFNNLNHYTPPILLEYVTTHGSTLERGDSSPALWPVQFGEGRKEVTKLLVRGSGVMHVTQHGGDEVAIGCVGYQTWSKRFVLGVKYLKIGTSYLNETAMYLRICLRYNLLRRLVLHYQECIYGISHFIPNRNLGCL
jgi:hypothetical protein